MKLNPETVLKRRPYLRLSLNSSDEVQVSADARTIKCGLHALYILELFSRPLSVAAAIRQLGVRYEAQAERVAAIATLFRLQEGGALRDVSAPDDTTTAPDDDTTTATDEAAHATHEGDATHHRDEGDGTLISDEVYFECALDETTRALVPYRERAAGEAVSARLQTTPHDAAELKTTRTTALCLNPRIALQTGVEPPPPLAARVSSLDHFSPRRPVLWVEDACTNVLAPYWLDDAEAQAFEQLSAGTLAPAALDAEMIARLTEARILIEPEAETARRRAWERACAELRRDLQTEQHAVLRKIIHPLQLSALRRYFRALDARGRLRPSSNKHYAHRRRSVYDEETARFVQQQITALVSRITPAPVRPSHSQVSVYQPGAFLRRHKDQPQYVWNLSLVVDAEPETDERDAWPICIEVEGRTREVRLEIGDAVLYRGSQLTHWRDVLPDARSVTLLFCFFSPEDQKR